MKDSLKLNPWLLFVGGVAIVLFASMAYVVSPYLGAKAPKVVKVQQGQLYPVHYVTSKKVPAVKIELCQGKQTKVCTTLIAKATGVEALAVIPGNFALGDARMKVTERNQQLTVTGKVQKVIPLVVTKSTVVASLNPAGNSAGQSGAVNSNPATTKPVATPPMQVYKTEVRFVCMYYPGAVNGNWFTFVSVDWRSPNTAVLMYRLKGDTDWRIADQRYVYNPAYPVRGQRLLYFSQKLGFDQDFEVQIQDQDGKSVPALGLPSKIYTVNSGHPTPYNGHQQCVVTNA